MSLLHGLGLGLAMIAFIGPVFFTLLKASLDHGFKAGVAVATGIMLSDILALLLCLLGAKPFFEEEGNHFFIAVVAGIILILIGLKYVLAPKARAGQAKTLKKKELLTYLTAGFMVNFINPFVFIVWIALVLHGQDSFGSGPSLWVFFLGVILGIFSTDILKAYFAQKLSLFLDTERLKKVYLLIGVAMIAFGIRAFYHASLIY